MPENSWWKLSEDSALIATVANVLEVSEHDVLALAYYWWYARPAPHEEMSRTIHVYLSECRAPSYARQYARTVLDADLQDPRQREHLGLNYIPRQETPPRYIAWAVTLAAMLALVVILFALSNQVSTLDIEAADAGGDDRPAAVQQATAWDCEGGPGMQALARFARDFADRPRADCR